MTAPPDNPAGSFRPVGEYDDVVRRQLTNTIRHTPGRLRGAVEGLTSEQLDTRYRNWTIRQITHHLADSHLHSIIRFKWALTEDRPKIKAYEESDWVQLADSQSGDIEPSLVLLDALHKKWVQLLEVMTPEQYARDFQQPQTGEFVSLWQALDNYAWHGRHHTAQVLWLRDTHGW